MLIGEEAFPRSVIPVQAGFFATPAGSEKVFRKQRHNFPKQQKP